MPRSVAPPAIVPSLSYASTTTAETDGECDSCPVADAEEVHGDPYEDICSIPAQVFVSLADEMCVLNVSDEGIDCGCRQQGCRTMRKVDEDKQQQHTTAVAKESNTESAESYLGTRLDDRDNLWKRCKDSQTNSNGHQVRKPYGDNSLLHSQPPPTVAFGSALKSRPFSSGVVSTATMHSNEWHVNGHQLQQPQRQQDMRQFRKTSDSILHIRSLDSNSSESYRHIRAALLQIRDSMSQSTASDSHASQATRLNGPRSSENRIQPLTEVAESQIAKVGEDEGDDVSSVTSSSSAPSTTASESDATRQISWPSKRCFRRPERLSMPLTFYGGQHQSSLTSDGDEEDEESKIKIRRRPTPKRRRSSVKFADEFGLNLNTFVMIPSRTRASGSRHAVAIQPSAGTARAATDSSTVVDGGETFSLSRYLRCSDGDNHLLGTSSSVATSGRTNLFCADQPTCIGSAAEAPTIYRCVATVGLTSTRLTDAAVSDVIVTSESTPVEAESATRSTVTTAEDVQVTESQFRLCFEQPFADQEKFVRKLTTQMVCLENVRVEDWFPGGGVGWGGSSSPTSMSASNPSSPPLLVAANSVMLCSIRVRNLHPEKRVFARCTDNGWRTFADLPAQHVGGIDSLGYEHDRFCFAVRRPSYASSLAVTQAWPDRGSRDTALPAVGTVAVEFAICYQAAGKTFWDNNEGSNYRIEWF